MAKKRTINAYMTVEAAWIIPLVLTLYLMILLLCFFLYNRCVISQDSYLLSFRGSRLTYGAENRGEVIYAEMSEQGPGYEYLETRLQYKNRFYPMWNSLGYRIELYEDTVVEQTGYGGSLQIIKRAKRINPLQLIKAVRKNAGKRE